MSRGDLPTEERRGAVEIAISRWRGAAVRAAPIGILDVAFPVSTSPPPTADDRRAGDVVSRHEEPSSHQAQGPQTVPTPVDDVPDGWARAIGIPAFGFCIPHLTGLFGPLTPRDGMFWFGSLWFVLLAAAVWQGNRALLFFQRRHLDWFHRPLFKIVALVAACVLYTAPVSALFLYAWYRGAGLVVDVETIVIVSLTNVICVLFVTHAYETAFLIKGRHVDTVHLADLQRTVSQAQLEALRKQVDPHFLFNSLNTLGALIESDPQAAAAFNIALADVYRYLLDERPLVPVEEERRFVSAYALLLQVRFGESVVVEEISDTTEVAAALKGARVAPTALQSLVENAVKHTRFTAQQPLRIRIAATLDGLVVENPKRPKREQVPSAGIGLKNLDERCRLLVGRGIDYVDDGETVCVRVPIKLRRTNAAGLAEAT